MDLVCVLPFSFFTFFVFHSSEPWILVVNLLAVRHVREIKPFLDHFDSLQPITYRLVPILASLPVLIHTIACGWVALGSGSMGPDGDKVLEYVKAMYWTFTTLTTVGYGDVVAKTIPQMIYSCGVQVVGVGVFGYILSNMASLLSRQDAARDHHMDNLDKIETFMRTHYIPTDLRGKVRAYYHYLWTNKKGYQDNALLESLPNKIQSELFFYINRSIIEKVPFLKGANQELIEDLMNQLEPRIYVPGEKVFRHGETGDALYFIHSGEVEILLPDQTLVATLREGAFFGEMALLSNKPRNATARTNSFCDVYLLRKSDFERTMSHYPEFRHHLEEVTRERLGA